MCTVKKCLNWDTKYTIKGASVLNTHIPIDPNPVIKLSVMFKAKEDDGKMCKRWLLLCDITLMQVNVLTVEHLTLTP